MRIPGRLSKANHAHNGKSIVQNFVNNLFVNFPRIHAAVKRLPRGDWDEFVDEQAEELGDILGNSYGREP